MTSKYSYCHHSLSPIAIRIYKVEEASNPDASAYLTPKESAVCSKLLNTVAQELTTDQWPLFRQSILAAFYEHTPKGEARSETKKQEPQPLTKPITSLGS